MKSYQTTEKIQPKQSQTTNEAPNAKETSLSDDLPDISFGQGNEQIYSKHLKNFKNHFIEILRNF